jgi:ATP-dependent DNA helicase RecG
MFAEANGDVALSIDIEPLRKILELEQKKGFLDSAVIGGLDKFLSNWSGRAGQSITAPNLATFQKLHPVESSYAS